MGYLMYEQASQIGQYRTLLKTAYVLDVVMLQMDLIQIHMESERYSQSMVKTSRQIKETDEGWLGARPWKLRSEHSGCQDRFLAFLL